MSNTYINSPPAPYVVNELPHSQYSSTPSKGVTKTPFLMT